MFISGGQKSSQMALYYLRLGLGFITLWSAWDVMVHQQQWKAFFGAFPLVGVIAGLIAVAWFFILLVAGLALLTGWYFREAAAGLGILICLSIIFFSFFTPKVNAVLGPFRPLMVKNLVWLGACLTMFIQATDPYNPERRDPQGMPVYAEKAHFIFRLLVGIYLIWDGILKFVDAHGYFTLLERALAKIPLIPDVLASGLLMVICIIQIGAGLLFLTGIKFRWAVIVLIALALIDLLGINWFATKGLLRAGGRFMMRDFLVLASGVYFWLSGPGLPILQVQVKKSRQSFGKREINSSAGENPLPPSYP
ncbi:hypothetical protein KAR10_09600 [bacterium]|nr:hypothetical protein [bacterium]